MMLLLQGLMRRFDCLRAAFSLRFYLYSFRNFFSYMPLPPPPPPQYWRSYQVNVMNWIFFFYVCAWSKHVRLRKRPITSQIFLPPWPLAVLSRIRVIRANAPIQLKWLPTGLIMSENPWDWRKHKTQKNVRNAQSIHSLVNVNYLQFVSSAKY